MVNNVQPAPLTVAIPTYRRERVLLESIDYVLAQAPPPAELLVLDQTEQHEAATDARLARLHADGRIRWLRLQEPSIPKAMNRALLAASTGIVLFLDDDIRPEAGLIAKHAGLHTSGEGLVAGRVIQPWHEGREFAANEPFHFACITPQYVREFMGGNFSVRRADAIALGGFDENFVRVAYRFEAEFAHRWRASGRRIFFEPAACIHHLKAAAGGTRTWGNQLTTWRPDHAVGAYYYAFRTGDVRELLRRPFSALATRYHLRHPWRLPGSALAELSALVLALRLLARGPSYLQTSGRASDIAP